jgi:hypothetical protein
MGNAASKKGSCGTQMSTSVVGASYCLERIHLQLIKTYIYICIYMDDFPAMVDYQR